MKPQNLNKEAIFNETFRNPHVEAASLGRKIGKMKDKRERRG